MEITNFGLTTLLVFLIGIQEIRAAKNVQITQQLDEKSNPLANLILNENEIGDANRNGDNTKDTLSRVKRQFYYDPYDPYYRRRVPIAVPVPVVVGGFGGGFIGRGFGRGFGGRGFGFGGRGFGGRGFGGRGFGGRGFGGRGFGGFGGRGGFGGFGGRGGRG